MIRRVAVLLALALLPALPSRAEGTAIVAVPGSFAATYATPVVVAVKGGSLVFVNGDLPVHDVVSDQTRAPGTAPWCPAGGPRCPLFYADGISLGGVTEVRGFHDIPTGLYTFRCTPHPWMEGTLVAI